VLVAYHDCDKIPEKINVREEGFILALCFRGFSLRSLDPIAPGSICGQAEHGGENVVKQRGSSYNGQEADRVRKVPGTKA
jgi:hypothetical protein